MIALVQTEEKEDEEQDPAGRADGQRGSTVVYLHGHPSTRIVELVREASRETDDATQALDPVKVCITATKGNVLFVPVE